MCKDSRLGLLLALLFAGSMWFYVQEVLIPYQKADAAAHGRPRGNLSDLYPRWLGARELLLRHRDPYSQEVTREIQIGYYGRPLEPDRADDPKDQQGFAYPVYVVFLLAPTIGLPFPVVQAGSRWLLAILTMLSVPLWLRIVHWRYSATAFAILLALTLGSFPVVQGIKLQQLTLLVGGLLAGCCAALVAGHFAVAGFLLALATCKPQLALPMAAWLVLWSASHWRRRQGFGWSFGLTMAVLLAASQYILPGWLGRFQQAVSAYGQYTQGARSLLEVLTTPALGKVMAAATILGVAAAGWHFRRVVHDSAPFSLMLALVGSATVVIVPSFAPYNQILLLPAVFLIATSWKHLWSRNWLTRAACTAGALVVFWPWVASCGLLLASLVLPAESVQRAWSAPLRNSLLLPVVVLGLLILCSRDLLEASRVVSQSAAKSP
ncbi:MAG TPA: glycosyltransferase family 87 protein [Terriglobales bacterium]|nr:glycosyltransferase family 87 protein [Terriglobales bacterium]